MAEASEAQGLTQADSSQVHEQTAAPEGAQQSSATDEDTNVAAPVSADAAEVAASADNSSEHADEEGGAGAASESDAPNSSESASPEEAAGASEASGDPTKRKRRRRKKRKGDSEAGEQEAGAAAAEGADARPKRREAPLAPFARFFAGAHGARKHGFAVGEVVAGRVKELAHGSIAVDLFGKAMAYADEFEPREVPPAPELLREPILEAASVADAATHTTTQHGAEQAADTGSASSEHVADAAATETAPTQIEASAAPAETASAAADSEASEESHETAVDESATTLVGEFHEDSAADLDAPGEATLSGEAAHAGHGPLPPAPIVPDTLPRPEPPALGQVFRGRVGAIAESGHIALVNRNFERQAVLANMQRYRDERRRVQGLVFGFNRGGFDVLVESLRAFCPASAMTLEELDDPTQLLGQKLEFLLPASQAVGKDIIVSRRSILERQLRKKAKELIRSLEPGQRLKGKVTSVREFGLFVDIGGIEGLVHQSELSFAHGVRPSDAAQVGDEVDVQVLRVGGDPRAQAGGGRKDRLERVSLSIKALLPDPWDAHGDALKEGSACAAKITRTTDFGAFVELVPQVEGLLHITELGRDLQHANQAVMEGDEVFVVIERVDKRARRISLSKLTADEMEEYKAQQAAGEEAPRNLRPGSRIKVKVVRVESRGLLVRASGVLGKRARGYLPASELVERTGDLRKAFPVGAELEVKIVGTDRDGSMRVSPKALQVDEERRAIKDYRRDAAKQGFGTFGDLLRAKIGQADGGK